MGQRDFDLDRLSAMLGQCLGRIDEHAYRVQRLDDDDDGFETADNIEHEAVLLQELMDTLLVDSEDEQSTDLNQLVERAVQACIGELGIPIVVRQRLQAGLPPVACAPNMVAYAVQRSLVLAVDNLDAGGELIIGTRREQDQVVFELESRGYCEDAGRDHGERAETLGEFVAGLGGRCRIAIDEQRCLLLGIELPTSLAIDEH